jgi:hypothetical protein
MAAPFTASAPSNEVCACGNHALLRIVLLPPAFETHGLLAVASLAAEDLAAPGSPQAVDRRR